MCGSCWESEGSPNEVTPETDRLVELINKLYETQETGTPLHCELDDWNVYHDVIQPSYVYRKQEEYTSEERAITDEIAAIMNRMTVPQRLSALARHEGLIK